MSNLTDHQDKNKLIEDFFVTHGGRPNMIEDLSFYESSWDILMPVVYKIHDVTPEKVREINSEGLAIFELALTTPIGDVHQAVVEFIEWYNQQKP